METSTSNETSGASLFKRVLIFVVAPALIAGFFSIAPKLYEEITKPTATLSYNVVAGPTFNSGSINQRIFAANVENSGRIPLTFIEADVKSNNSKIDNLSTDRSLINPTISLENQVYHVKISKLLPHEKVSLSILATSPSETPQVQIELRSNEVTATEETGISSRKGLAESLTGGLLSGISVAMMAIYTIYRSRYGGSSSLLNPTDREDILAFVSGLSGIEKLHEQFLQQSDKTYVRFADILYTIAVKAENEKTERCIKCLQCLILCNSRNDSADIARFYLSLLRHEISDQDYKNLRKKAISVNGKNLSVSIIDILR